MSIAFFIVSLLVLAISTWYDLTYERIPNVFVLPCIAAGLMGHRNGLFCPSPASLFLYSYDTCFLLIPADTGLLFPVVHAGYFPMA